MNNTKNIASTLIKWYQEQSHKAFPWRNDQDDIYRVWISETMLQQTTVHTIAQRYPTFIETFPTVDALAQAHIDTVMEQWAGLGYYARARNMHRAAQIMVTHGYPTSPETWENLPGVGPYIAHAISAIAQQQPTIGIDVHVKRILHRIHPPSTEYTPKDLQTYADTYATKEPRIVQQAFFDIGRQFCRPYTPDCTQCPIAQQCTSANTITDPRPPRKKRAKPQRVGHAYAIIRQDTIYMVRRPPHGLLGGTLALPSIGWSEQDDNIDTTQAWKNTDNITHSFSHFDLTMHVHYIDAATYHAPLPIDGAWININTQIKTNSLFRKCIAQIYPHNTQPTNIPEHTPTPP